MKVKMSTLITVAALLMILIVAMIIVVARADAGNTTSAWVICKPGGLVHVRSKPGGSVQGSVMPCREVHTDGKTRNGWVHVVDLGAEDPEGWIHVGYIVTDEPEELMGAPATVTGEGRVACRESAGGSRIKGNAGWIQPGETVQVFYWSDEWAVTNRGFVMTKYLERTGNDDLPGMQ